MLFDFERAKQLSDEAKAAYIFGLYVGAGESAQEMHKYATVAGCFLFRIAGQSPSTADLEDMLDFYEKIMKTTFEVMAEGKL